MDMLMEATGYLLMGMGGIFIVMGLVSLSIMVLNRFFKG